MGQAEYLGRFSGLPRGDQKAAPTPSAPFRQRFLHWRRSASEDAVTSDHSVRQLIAKDDARDLIGSGDNEVDAAQNVAERSEYAHIDTDDEGDIS